MVPELYLPKHEVGPKVQIHKGLFLLIDLTDCDVSPHEVCHCQECKLQKLKLQDGDGEANMADIDDGHILYPPYAIY